ncbi:hypothetical protein SLS57_009873 [Botryosphaeria dothidea]
MRSTTFFILVFLGLTAATALPQLEQDRRCAGGVIVCQKGTNQRCWKNCSLRQCHCPDDATNRSCDTDFAKDDFCGDCKDGWHDFYEAQGLGQKANLRSITLFFNYPQIRVHQESPPKSRKEWCLLLAPNTANQASNDARMG